MVRRARAHEHQVRVTYADTDRMGLIYYANYFKYFEAARTELARSVGIRWRDLETGRRIYLPAVETGCRYLSPARYDDLLIVRTWIPEMKAASLRFEHEILSQDSSGTVARGFSRHAVLDELWKHRRIPADLRLLLDPFVGDPPQV
jgi:acyl-CoA thioester hydrolase